MVAVTTSRLRRVLGWVLILGMTLLYCGDQAQARRRHRSYRSHLLFGFQHYWPPYYYWSPYYWPSYYWSPYYWPPYYWPYTPYYYGPYDDRPYAPAERRRFLAPAFHLPGLFHYLGALAKDEPIGSATEQPGTTTPQSGPKATKP